MPADTVASLIDTVIQLCLLEGERHAELPSLRAQFVEPRALIKELVRRGWLTTYQANQLSQGTSKQLAPGPYVLLDKLGEGGMGQVFKARHVRLGRIDAVKVIRKERLERPDTIRRFYREIRAAAQLRHPNIVHAYDADEVDGVHYFSMEYVNGIDLGTHVKKLGPLPVAEACDYIRQAALGVPSEARGRGRGGVSGPGSKVQSVRRAGGRKPPGDVRIIREGSRRVQGEIQYPSGFTHPWWGFRVVCGIRSPATSPK